MTAEKDGSRLLAPAAIDQQKFRFACADERVTATAGRGFCAKTDPGIAKCQFEPAPGHRAGRSRRERSVSNY